MVQNNLEVTYAHFHGEDLTTEGAAGGVMIQKEGEMAEVEGPPGILIDIERKMWKAEWKYQSMKFLYLLETVV